MERVPIVGIDLGTSNSLVGHWSDGQSVLIPNALGSVLTPSAVSIDAAGSVHVGATARDHAVVAPSRAVFAFKRAMGTEKTFGLGSRTFRAEELSALVLRSLKADAEAYLGHPVTEAVITVPAYFNDAQRTATKVAGELAGLRVERLLNEPTAAALAYGLLDTARDDAKKFVVVDLGGGTFDVSVIDMFEGIVEVRATAGDNFLGGEDFVDAIVDRFLDRVGAAAGIPPRAQPDPIHALVRRAAEVAKRRLTEERVATIAIPYEGRELAYDLDADEFAELGRPLIERLKAPIVRALNDSRLRSDEISAVVLAGGATRMLEVRRLVSQLFRQLPLAHVGPDEVVARGAAVQAGLKMRDAALDETVLTDVAAFTLGIETVDGIDGAHVVGAFSPIIERNTVIPASRVRRYSAMRVGQTNIEVPIYQGESRYVADNVRLGSISVTVPRNTTRREEIDVRFTYDTDGILEVEVTSVATGATKRLVIEGRPGALTAEQIAQRLRALASLKVHPREQAENAALLARADRLYQEQLGDVRERVGAAHTRFAAALEGQDARVIAEERARLTDTLDQIAQLLRW
jgi:molecular chaperone HscC